MGPGEIPRIALTGGIASGKSTVAKLFQTLGARLIDTDQIARDILAPGSPALDAVVQRFGPDILDGQGSLDRPRLREQVFRDSAARRDLEAITHPLIRAGVARRSRQLGGPYQLVAIPLLAEAGTRENWDRVLVVDCSPETQLRRLVARDRMDLAAAQRMIAAQAPREARLALADDVIVNEGDVAGLAPQVEVLHKAYLRPPGYAK